MTKKPWTLISVALALGALLVFRLDFWRMRQIQINASVRPHAPNAAPDDPLPIIFGLDQDWKLTGLRVMPVSELSNARPKMVWNLVSKSGSTPTRAFMYGDAIQGMQAAPGVTLVPLIPGVVYRMELEAVRARGQVDFTPQAAGEPR
ncbi:MAG: hypothetical protein JNL10_12135 [Verrucomicrobiales bacterium]|nr:hypothetical protein [Verrucomicrobiales bacterium]